MLSAEIALSFLAYNLRRAINLLGAGALTKETGKTGVERPLFFAFSDDLYKK